YVEAPGLSWTDARQQALDLGGHLVNIGSEGENAFVYNNVTLHRPAWIGASDAGHEGDWTWSDGPEAGDIFWQGDGEGDALGYANWWGTEPNGGTSENYAFIDHNRVWTDVPASYGPVQGFVVEFSDLSAFTTYKLANTYGNSVFNIATGELT